MLCLAFNPRAAWQLTGRLPAHKAVPIVRDNGLASSLVARLEANSWPNARRAAWLQLCAAPSERIKQGERLFGVAELNLIYDSKCSVCQWEIDFLKSRDVNNRLTYTDLESADFEEGVERNGFLDYETALASFHAVTADGELLNGMPVFQAAYSAVGLGWVWRIYNNPIAAKILDLGYSIFAKYRTDLTRGSSFEALVSARRAAQKAAEECKSCTGMGPGGASN